MTEKDINTENTQGAASEQQDQNKHRTFAHTIQRRKWGILIITMLFVAAAILYIVKAVPIYTSTARILVEQRGPKIITEYEGVMTQSKNYLYTQGEILKSATIISAVLGRKDIKNLKTLTNRQQNPLDRIKYRIGLGQPSFQTGEIDNLAAYLNEIIDVKIGIKDDIIAVNCRSPYSEEAAAIVNAIVEAYIDYNAGQKKNTVSEVLRILQKDKVERDKELEGNFEQLLDFTRKYGVISYDKSGGNATFQRLKNLSDSLSQAELDAINAKANLQAVKMLADNPLQIKQYAMAQPDTGATLLANDMEKQLRTELKDINAELQNALIQCSEDHPTVKALRSKMTGIEEQLDAQAEEFAKSYLAVLEIEYTTATQRLDELTAAYQQQIAETQNLNVKATEYAILESKLEQSKRFCEILDNRIKELNVSEDVGALNISILEAARAEELATSPKKAKIVALNLILGIVFG
ncbi:MAG: Wzz/FepE/Etk N-terminal domain-containing protein, partial [Phycisphaerae bacterium]|nr:Wzz/FepE/Etk N-terminal domain-containing protein [Phycisphaerae bacterium]